LKRIPISDSDFEEILWGRRRFIFSLWDHYKRGSLVRLAEVVMHENGAVRRLTGQYVTARVRLCDAESAGLARGFVCLGIKPCRVDLWRATIYRAFFAQSDTPKSDENQANTSDAADENDPGGPFYDLNLLPKSPRGQVFEDEIQQKIDDVIDAFKAFHQPIGVRDIAMGARCLTLEIYPHKVGTKLADISKLKDEIALALGVESVRIYPAGGKILLEIPKKHAEKMLLGDALCTQKSKLPLSVALGADLHGNPVFSDIEKLPHLLIGGTTRSGKSVLLNAILLSLLCRAPEELRLILIDPKRVEFAPYNGLPHLVAPICHTPEDAQAALFWAVEEMERRYELLQAQGARELNVYNKWKRGEKRLPKLVIICDEYADLLDNGYKSAIENLVERLARKSRAAGIHMIFATQRPDADTVSGVIKANFSGRVALQVADDVNSKIILNQKGAENLLGNGDMLYSDRKTNELMRLQGFFVSDDEVNAVTDAIRAAAKKSHADAPEFAPKSDENQTRIETQVFPEPSEEREFFAPLPQKSQAETLLDRAIQVGKEQGIISISILKTELCVGYERAKEAYRMLEDRGFLGPEKSNKPRKFTPA
jgi:S-DNA-T family DNA segregation ATPase FtsK/SpoIIIE